MDKLTFESHNLRELSDNLTLALRISVSFLGESPI